MKESSSAAVPLIPDPLSPVPFGTATGLLKTFRQASGVSTSNCSCIAVFVMLSALISRQNCYCHRFARQSLYGSESRKPFALAITSRKRALPTPCPRLSGWTNILRMRPL